MVGFVLVGLACYGMGILAWVFRKWSARMQREWAERHLPPWLRGPAWLETVNAVWGTGLAFGFGTLMILIAFLGE